MSNDKWPEFLTVAEIALIMRVSKMSVYRLVKSGDLPGVKIGRSYRVSESVFNDYLAASGTVLG